MMRRALALASLGRGSTSPNPLVGAVIAKAGKVVAYGFHRRAGGPHAEVIALNEAHGRARGGTLYTNLEPCCHTGRTPPCVIEIIRAGVNRVVSAMPDPDPRVNGKGFRKLRRHGVVVDVGLLREEAVRLNRAFAKFVRHGLPLVTLKGAMSLDGRIATRTGDSKWITSAEAREHARLLRREHDAVMVGIGTAAADDPLLTARGWRSRRPPVIRAIMDTHLRLSPHALLVETIGEGPVVVFCGTRASRSRAKGLRDRGVEVERLPLHLGKPDISKALQVLGARGIIRVLVEGGAELHASFVERQLADRLVLYMAPRLIGGVNARPLVGGKGASLVNQAEALKHPRVYRVGTEFVIDADFEGMGRY